MLFFQINDAAKFILSSIDGSALAGNPKNVSHNVHFCNLLSVDWNFTFKQKLWISLSM